MLWLFLGIPILPVNKPEVKAINFRVSAKGSTHVEVAHAHAGKSCGFWAIMRDELEYIIMAARR